MSEPRKSLRATKGINPKIDQLDSPADMGKKGTAKKVTKKKAVEEEEEEGDVRCVCGADTDDGGDEAWIACDVCKVWQHNVCVGVSTFEDEIPENYLCEQHDPHFHRELLDAIKAGHNIWEDRRKEWERRQTQDEPAKKKGKKGGRKSEIGTNGKANASSTPIAEIKKDASKGGSSKRKERHESHDKEPNSKMRKVTASLPAQQKTPPTDSPVKIIDLEQKRQGPAKLIHKALLASIPIAVKTGVFAYLGDDTLETKAERLAIQVETAVFDTHPTDGPYIKQCRAIAANLKQNQELSNSLLVKTINPRTIAVMTSDDMATRELKQETAAMKARADKQSILLTDDGPRIRRTHKGEEIIGGDDQMVANDSTMSTSRRRSMLDPNADMATRSRENSPGDQVELPDIGDYRSRDDIRGNAIPKQPLNIETKAPPVRKHSTQPDFDINKVFSSIQSPTGPSPHIRRPSGNAAPPPAQGNDPDIDNLLREDPPESPPYSPAEYDSDPNIIWRGAVIMDSIASFSGVAKHVAGADLSKVPVNPMPWSDVLQKDLRIAGRIDLDKANVYLCSLRYSPPTDVVVVQVTPTGEEAAREFKVIFDYFHPKKRYGVLTNKGIGNIRDTYLVPVAPSPEPLPDFLINLEAQQVPEVRSEPSLLVVLVIRNEWQPDPRSFDGPMSIEPQSPSIPHNPQFQHQSVSALPSGPGPAMSPIAAQNPSFGSTQSSTPSAPSHQQNQEQVRVAQQLSGEETARRILGYRVNDPTVGFLMPNAAIMRPIEWDIIKRILESDERARTDLMHLSSRLEKEINQEQK